MYTSRLNIYFSETNLVSNRLKMGERKGQNMYYPPDYDPGKGGLNKSQGTHALRERARKLHLGILIIRFEMPYNIWCEGCGNHIGMGVRYVGLSGFKHTCHCLMFKRRS